jgi:NhaP-type Na+/H+ or K+/H+ antiporter
MTLALTAIAAIAGFWALSAGPLARFRLFQRAAAAPAAVLGAGALVAVLNRLVGAPALPADLLGAAGETGLAALVFVSAAQLRVSRLASQCPASFRLTLGGAPLFLFVCSLCAFVLLPQLSPPSAMLLGAALMLNGAAFDRRAVTAAPAPAAIKSAVRIESAAIIALGAPVAMILAGNAIAPDAGEAPLGPLLAASLEVLKGFALGGAVGFIAGRHLERRSFFRGPRAAFAAGLSAFLLSPLIGAEPVIAAGAAGLLWGEETRTKPLLRLRMRRLIERGVAPAAYFAFAAALAPRLFQADLLTVLFAVAAVTVMRAGPRLAMLQTSALPKEAQVFLAWFGGAPGAASALFVLSLIDDPMIVEHDAFLTVSALAVALGVGAARLTSKPLAKGLVRQLALARRRRALAG